MPRVLHLPDVSEYQPDVDWGQVVATQRRRWLRRRNRGGAAIIRAHNGRRADNAWHSGARRAAAHKAGIKALGLYLYLPASVDVATAVRGFVATVGKLLPGEFVVLDLEEGAGDQSGRAKRALALLNRKLHYPGYHGAWLYSYLGFIDAHGLRRVFESVRGWIAAYGSTEPSSIRHDLWQHSSTEAWPGIGKCDCSIFNGSLSALLARIYTPPAKPKKRGGVVHPAPPPAAVPVSVVRRLLVRLPQLVQRYVKTHPNEVKHDVAVFVAAFTATGVLEHGSVTVVALTAAAVAAGRRVVVDAAPRFVRWAVRRLT